MMFGKGNAEEPVRQEYDASTGHGFSKKLRWLIAEGEHAEFMVITPAMASEMMERNTDEEYRNRPQNQGTIRRYARAIQDNRWVVTGEPIIFSEDGVLLNGQHRLKACILCGESFRTLVVFGIEREAFKFMDRGLKRTAAHVFSIEGVPNATLMAACVSWYDRLSNTSGWTRSGDIKLENEQLLDLYYEHEGLQESAWVSHRISTEGESLISNALMTTLHYLFSQKSRRDADEFMEKVITGVGIENQKQPENKLRKWLQKDNRNISRSNDLFRAVFVVQAWNARRTGKPITNFVWRTEQRPNQPFPSIR